MPARSGLAARLPAPDPALLIQNKSLNQPNREAFRPD
jgi:hypothetical protein